MPGPVPAAVGTKQTSPREELPSVPATLQPDLRTRNDRRRQGGRAFGSDPMADCCATLSKTPDILSVCFFPCKCRHGATFLGSLRHGGTRGAQTQPRATPNLPATQSPFFSTLQTFLWLQGNGLCSCYWVFNTFPTDRSPRAESFHQPTATWPCFQGVYFRIMVGHPGTFPLDSLYSVPFFRGGTPKFPCDPS